MVNESGKNVPHWIAVKIAVHFDANELVNLCLMLGISYDSIGGNTKERKAVELVLYYQRRNELDKLIAALKVERPMVDFSENLTLGNVTRKLPPERKRELEYIVNQLEEHYRALLEWKELHKYLDNILNVSFDQYYFQVKDARAYQRGIDSVKRTWLPVNRSITLLLTWAQKINYIGTRYERPEGKIRGERWAVELDESCQAISNHLKLGPNFAGDESGWWEQLHDLSGEFDDRIKLHMSLADDELRTTAILIYDLSQKLLRQQV